MVKQEQKTTKTSVAKAAKESTASVSKSTKASDSAKKHLINLKKSEDLLQSFLISNLDKIIKEYIVDIFYDYTYIQEKQNAKGIKYLEYSHATLANPENLDCSLIVNQVFPISDLSEHLLSCIEEAIDLNLFGSKSKHIMQECEDGVTISCTNLILCMVLDEFLSSIPDALFKNLTPVIMTKLNQTIINQTKNRLKYYEEFSLETIVKEQIEELIDYNFQECKEEIDEEKSVHSSLVEYKKLLADFLKFAQLDHVVPLRTKKFKAIANEWAKDKRYTDLQMFNSFYPIDQDDDFEWLDKKLLKQKQLEHEKDMEILSSFFNSSSKLLDGQPYRPSAERALFDYLRSMDNISYVTIYNPQQPLVNFFIDSWGRVWEENETAPTFDFRDFYTSVKKLLSSKGTITIRNITKEVFEKPKTKDDLEITYHNIYGLKCENQSFTSVAAKDLEESFKYDAFSKEYVGLEPNLRFFTSAFKTID